ncbi:MAG: hypothetical protein Q8N16_03520 [bacterium]|nr:hypothetical protein [bacterium]
MNLAKVFGWLLLLAGLAIIIYGLYASFGIFTGKTAVPEIFKLDSVKTGKTPKISAFGGEIDLSGVLGSELGQFLPANSLPKTLNLVAWSIFTGILILGGSQIAGLGIKLIK